MVAGTPAAGVDAQLRAWLQQGNWPGLQSYFAANRPQTAAEFAARALLLARAERTRERSARIVADWREACRLQPRHLLHFVNLAQALLDDGQAEQACSIAEGLVRQAPEAFPAAEKLALALQACARWPEAAQAATRLEHLAAASGLVLDAATRTAHASLASRWWEPVAVGGAVLRLPRTEDFGFLQKAFGDATFMRRFHRYQRGDDTAVRDFIARAGRPPHETRRRDWVLASGGTGEALASIVDIDLANRRGELLVGVPADRCGASLALKAAVGAVCFAFEHLALDKLISYVYGDNPEAQANTLHLGFRCEGLLRSHLVDGPRRLDLHVNGLLRAEFETDVRWRRLRARWMGGRTSP